MPKTVFVNVTAAQDGGSLTIINQFLEFFSLHPVQHMQLIVFCSVPLSNFGNENIVFVPFERQNFYRRLYWDYWGMKKWAAHKHINPDVILSFQNTGVFFKKIPQIIYLHQSIPFSNMQWNPFKKEERSLWFYKNIYPFFIKITLFPQSRFVVQTQWMKNAVSKHFNFPADRIIVAKPECNIPHYIKPADHLANGFIHLFYPARTAVYKNHLQIVKVAYLLSQNSTDNVRFHFTCAKDELSKDCQRMIDAHDLDSYFVFHNKLDYTQVLGLYQIADCLIFPSKIETIGLPLLEAAATGMSIICTDMAYARETLKGYKNVVYVKPDDTESWANAILQNKMRRISEPHIQNITSGSGWKNVIQLLAEI